MWRHLHEGAATEGDYEEDHGEEVGEVDFDRLPKLGPEVVVRLRVVENVDARRPQKPKVDAADDAELDRAVPVEEEVLDQEPDQVLDQEDHLLELSVLPHG